MEHPTISIALLVILIKLALIILISIHLNFFNQTESNFISIWEHWDSNVYKTIATTAYDSSSLKIDTWAFLSHFGPLYPLMMFVVSNILNTTLATSGFLISTTAIIIASVVLFKLVCLENKSTKVAWLAVIMLNIYPLSYFTIAVYSESLFLLFTLLSFYYLKKERFVLCGLASAGAFLTRIVGVVFVPFYIVYILNYIRTHRKITYKALYPLLISFSAWCIFFIINKVYYGSFFYFLTENLSFNNRTKHLVVPFSESFTALVMLLKNNNFSNIDFMMSKGWNAVFTFFVLIITFLGHKKIKWEYTLFSFLSILIFASLSWGISNARYTLPIFPMYIILGYINNKVILSVISTIFVFLLLYFAMMFTRGFWAF